MKLSLFLLLTSMLFLVSCKNQEECQECQEEPMVQEDAPKEEPKENTVEPDPMEEEVIDETVDVNYTENKKKIEEKFGDQWTFCRCVKANDSLDKLIKSGADLDDSFMKTFDEVDTKCKAFLVMSPNQTPEDRDKHEEKIKNCLKN